MQVNVQVPGLVRMTKDALASDRCVVIGLQSTGEARTADVIAEKGEELDDFVSGPKVTHATMFSYQPHALPCLSWYYFLSASLYMLLCSTNNLSPKHH